MRRLRELILRFGGLFNKQRQDRELEAEIESHVQMHIEDNLQLGMPPEEARRQAMIKLGGIESTKEAYRGGICAPLAETFRCSNSPWEASTESQLFGTCLNLLLECRQSLLSQ